jgi:OOP family OmpA-OmpF porin
VFATIDSNNKRGMAMNGKAAVAILGMVAALIAGPAAAQGRDESGLYLGGSVGYSQYKDVCKNLFIPCDGNDTAWRLFGGYQFNRNWAAEFGYGDFGEAHGSGTIPAGGNATFRTNSYGFDLTGIGNLYLTQRLSLFGRLGVYMGRTTRDIEYSAFPASNAHDAKTNSGFTFGAGLGYNLGRVGVRAEWQRYDNIGTNDNSGIIGGGSGTDEVDVFSLAVLFRFF